MNRALLLNLSKIRFISICSITVVLLCCYIFRSIKSSDIFHNSYVVKSGSCSEIVRARMIFK